MEFKFNVSEIFPGQIVEINQSLIPPGFSGDRRSLWDVVTKVSEIVNSMGDASATAQGLTKPITSADRLRNSEQTIYLLVDRRAKSGKGVVTGMLKTGKKSLYVFDRDGHHYQVSPPCVLDFYVHESRQRTGLGKQLFEHMLQTEKVEPVKMAVDRPSEKLLSFLDKHYGLNSALRQMNNYVVFDGFFPEPQNQNINGDGSNSGSPSKAKTANGLQQNYASPYGRYGAPRPPCSMGQIIHNQSPVQSNEPSGVSLNQTNTYVTQSTPAMQRQQHIHSNQGYADVCQSAPNVPYPQVQAQQPVHPNTGQQNLQYYGETSGMPQQQQQPNVSSYSNMQQQHIHQHQQQHQYPNMQNQQLNMQAQQPNMQTQQLDMQVQQLNMQGQPTNMPQYQQHLHQHRNMQQYQQEDVPQQQQPNIKYHPPNNGLSLSEEDQDYVKNIYMRDPYHIDPVEEQRLVLPQSDMLAQHQRAHHMVQNVSQPHLARTASSYSGISTQHQQLQTPQQFTQPLANQVTMAPQRGGGTPTHQHMVASPSQQMITPQQGVTYQEMLTPQQALPSQQHAHPHQMLSPHQAVPSQHNVHSHQHVHPHQMVSPRQTVPSQHAVPSQHVHPQQMVSPQQAVPSQQHVHPHQMVSSHQILPPQHTPHHHVHPQQTVPAQQALPSPPPTPHEVSPSQPIQGHGQFLQTAQPQSMPQMVNPAQQLSQLQSMPGLQSGQGTVPYQQYIQPPNTEQPVQLKPQYETVAHGSGQSTPHVPYQYYDSSKATMQTVYSQPNASSSRTIQNVNAQQTPNAAGDMPSGQKSLDRDQGKHSSSGRATPSGHRADTPRSAGRAAHVMEREPMSSLLQDQSGQMQRMQSQGHPLNGEHHKALDDSVSHSPKLERPRSLSIQRSEEAENLDKKISNDVKGEVHSKAPKKKSEDELDNIENDVQKLEIAEHVPQLNAANSSEKNSVDGSDDSENRSKSPNPLTAQGFFDLKFYHSRLW